jgi:tRNA (pseudouridine54-N1)-methyltransferase
MCVFCNLWGVTRFAIIGQKASASADFLLDDLPGTSGRLDILLRCLRAALLSSHGLRRQVVVYLVLLGGPLAPRVLRVDGSTVTFLRPDERSLAVLAKKVLSAGPSGPQRFLDIRPGVALASGGIEVVLGDCTDGTKTCRTFVLDEHGADVRDVEVLAAGNDELFVVGDHMGIPDDIRERLDRVGASPISIGAESIHADDVVAVLMNEIARRRVR